MSLSVPSRRLLRGAPALATSPTTTTTTTTTSSLLPALQALSLSPNNAPSSSRPLHTTPANQWFWSRNKKNQTEGSALEQQISGAQDSRKALINKLTSRLQGPAIFEDELKDTVAATTPDTSTGLPGVYTRLGTSLAREHLARAADPDPRSRARWERKMAIRAVHRGTDPFSREPRVARIARTERQLTSASPPLGTSTKKLVHLAHQIQGKTVADALVQMRFSKKKMAQEVRHQLEIARDLAVVERGMGLGAAASKSEGTESNGNGKPLEIQTKDGKWIKIDDPTRMYVAEAWVNRSTPRGKQPDYRARGRMNIKINRASTISIVLKEEKTRIREAAEREAKKVRQGPWVHLPDRPVTAQRQWYSW
ncbi:ribosomal protein L22/L17 [Parachaetomium inaequale]|uniref:Ribosomal protein L22/L17 n=1 Tax=Parachaetomium inaequale TaxID=2588326 RepID=A0AAN6SS96_9PEZI|nr:ribosomal protein L22/L17 [Parachaetomium inaequale]